MRSHLRLTGSIAGSALVLALFASAALGNPAATSAAEETRFCVTVRSDEPIEGDLLEAVASGEASVTIEAASACAGPTQAEPTPTPESSPTLVRVPETVIAGTPAELLASLAVKPENASGYDRKKFKHWTSASGNGCDTRQQVLIDESLTPATVGANCKVEGGSWISVFDGQVTTDPSTFDIDHVVPLKEAWRSSARTWTGDRRREFANDLDDERSLRAVSATSNRSKGARDPAEWLPPDAAFRCDYASDWVVIKTRWGLAVDEPERQAIEDVLDGCPADVVSVEPV